MPDLTSLLSTPASDVKPPPNLPVGDYIFQVDKFEIQKNPDDTLKAIIVFCEATAPIDVDPSLLDGITFPVKMRNNFNFGEKNPNSLFYLTEFLKACGLSTDSGQTVGQLLEQCPGQRFQANVTQTPDKTPGSSKMYSNIGKAVPLA